MAAPGCRNYPLGSGQLRFCVDEVGSSNVDVRLSTQVSGTHNWTMHLQRQVNGVWGTIGTQRTGFVSPTSASHRQFTNVGKQNANMRVLLVINGTTYNSPTWRR